MEKKLTDEEIVKALEYEKEHLLREEKLTGNAYDTQSVYMRGEGVLAILDLIHRQKAEIERLTEELEIAKGTKNRLTIFDRIEIHDKTVKDTADKILGDLRNIFIEQSSYGCDANQHIGYYDYEMKIGLVIEQIEEYAKEKYGIEYGVEVE